MINDFPPSISTDENEEIRFWANQVKVRGTQVRYRYDIGAINGLKINRTDFYVNLTSEMFGADEKYMNTLNILF